MDIKEHIPRRLSHAPAVTEKEIKEINQVVAENLAHWMSKSKMKQPELANRAGVSQKTISNYLNPQQRTKGSQGKAGSPKLYELDKIAKAMNIEVWQLTRQMTARERVVYEALERAYRELLELSESPNP